MRPSNTLFLTGLRGYSALAVFLVHAGGGLRALSPGMDHFVNFGRYGVVSFFVLSALTLSMSIDRSREFSYGRYLLRRLSRIFPMYCFAIVLFWSLGGMPDYQHKFHVPPWSLADLLLHLSFLNLWNVRYQNTVIGVEWTIPLEMWAYLVIPLMFFGLRRAPHVLRWLVLLLAIKLASTATTIHLHHIPYHAAIEQHWAIEQYLYCFVAGVVAYSYWDKIKLPPLAADAVVAVMLLLLGAICFWPSWRIEQWLTLLMIGLVLGLTGAGYTRAIFENRVAVFVGNISFSFYLLHMPILCFLQRRVTPNQAFLLGLAITSALAYVTYRLIEKPFLSLTAGTPAPRAPAPAARGAAGAEPQPRPHAARQG
jgi:peptidoglycan/LPS O-acetylase OafA/YrhL